MSTTDNNVHVSDDVLALLTAKAEAENKTVDQVAEEALRESLKEESWQELLDYGLERGKASGYTEEQVTDVVRDWRKENHGLSKDI